MTIVTCARSCFSEVKSWCKESKRKSANAERHVGTITETKAGKTDISFWLWPL